MLAITMSMKYSDLSQSDRLNWVMWQAKDPWVGGGGGGEGVGVSDPGKIAFIKTV